MSESERWDNFQAKNREFLAQADVQEYARQMPGLFAKLELLQNAPADPSGADNTEIMVKTMQQIMAVFEKMTQLRVQYMQQQLHSISGATDKESVGDALSARIDWAFEQTAVQDVLKPIAAAVSVDPLGGLKDQKSSFRFYWKNGKQILVDNKTIGKAQRQIADVRNRIGSSITLEQSAILAQLDRCVEQILIADPAAHNARQVSDALTRFSTGTDFNKPLLLIGGLGASLIAAVGLGIWAKTGKTSWPTFLWLGIAALMLNPDLLQKKGIGVLQQLAVLNTREVQGLITTCKLSGDDGAAAVQELFSLPKNQQTELRRFIEHHDTIDARQLSSLGISTDGKLGTALARAKNDADRRNIIAHFLSFRRKDTQQVVVEYLQSRGVPKGPFIPPTT